jgi:hypothetical protein
MIRAFMSFYFFEKNNKNYCISFQVKKLKEGTKRVFWSFHHGYFVIIYLNLGQINLLTNKNNNKIGKNG